MFRSLQVIVLLLMPSTCLFAEEIRWGAEPLSLPTAELYRAAAESVSSGNSDVENLFEERHIRIENDGRSCRTRRLIYRVLTEVGVEEFGSVEAEWSPWYQDRPTIQARVINSDDDEVRLIDREIVEGPVQQSDSVYSDTRQLQAPLPAVKVGSVIEVVVTTQDRQCFFASGAAECFMFNRLYPTQHVRLVVDIADKVPFHYSASGPGLKFSKAVRDGRNEFVWETLSPIWFDEIELNAPSDLTPGTQVAFSTAESWAAVVAGYSELIDSKLNAPELEAQVKKLVEGETDPDRKADKLLAYVRQQIRYTGLMFGDGSIVPAPPEETLRRRYGDCKDQSTLLIAMLRHAGLDANPVLVKCAPGREVLPAIPGLGIFNHMIVHVSGEKEFWIDPVATTVPLGQLPIHDQNRQCLIIRNGETSLTKSPGSQPSDNTMRRVREFRIVETGDSTLRETTVYTGALASDLRQLVLSASEKEFRSSFRERTKERCVSSDVNDIEVHPVRDTSSPLEISVTCNGTGLVGCDLSVAEVLLGPATVLQGVPEEFLDTRESMSQEELETCRQDPFSSVSEGLYMKKQRPRTLPLEVQTPQIIQVTNRIYLPQGFEVVDVPENCEYKIGNGYLKISYKQEAVGIFVAEFTSCTGSGQLTPDELRQWQQCIRDLVSVNKDSEEEWYVVLRAEHSANQHLAKGNLKLGLQHLRAQVLKQPENPAHQIRLAEAYVDAGFADIARQQALQATQKHPDSAAACLAAARILNTPSVPGVMVPVADRKRAIELCREALRLAPQDQNASVLLASLLQCSVYGISNDRSTLQECAQLIRVAENDLLPGGHALVLEFLFMAEDHQEVLKYHDKHGTDDSHLIFKLASLAITEGVENALGVLKRELPPESQLMEAVKLEQYLELQREYSKASEVLLFIEKLPEGRNLPIRSKISILKATRHYEAVLKPDKEPIGVVQRLLINALTHQEICGPNETLLHHSGDRFDAIANHIVTQLVGREPFDELRSVGRIADTISLAEFRQAGNASTGYRVTASLGFLAEVTFFLSPIDGKLKVLTTTELPESLGEDAQQFLTKGQLLQARQCITWAADEFATKLRVRDPFFGAPLAHIWTKNDATGANAVRVRYAAMMLSPPEKCPDALKIFWDMRRQVRQPEQIQIDRAIVDWVSQHKKWKDGIAAVDRLLPYAQGRDAYWTTKVMFLTSDRQFAPALAWIDSLLKKNPADPGLLMVKSRVLLEQGNIAESLRLARKACNSHEAGEAEYSHAARVALLAGVIDDRAIADSEKAVEMAQGKKSAALLTLASIWAEKGKVNDAMMMLQRGIQASGGGQGISEDDFVCGRVAEQMGMADVAQFYYDGVLSSDESHNPTSTSALVAKRRGKMKTASHQKPAPVR